MNDVARMSGGKLRFRVGAIVALCVLGFAVWGWFGGRSDEPTFEGKTLSEWLVQLEPNDQGNSGLIHNQLTARFNADKLEARAAVQALGTNQLPVYLELLQRRNMTVSGPLRELIRRWDPKSRWIHPEVSATDRMRGALAIHALGESALPLKSELITLMTNGYSTTQSAHALAGLGPDVIPEVTSLLNHTNSWTRLCATWILAQNGAAAQGVVTNLSLLLSDPSSSQRHLAVWALGCIGGDEDWILPIIRERLEDKNKGVRRASLDAVKKLNLDQAQKRQLVSPLTNDTDAALARYAQTVLTRFDAE